MTCHNCQSQCKRFGKSKAGNQRFRCRQCSRTFTDSPPRPLADMRLPVDRALMCLKLIVEGNSIRSTERITGVHRDTILSLLVLAGRRCEELLGNLVTNVPAQDVQCDELWGYVGMKEKAKGRHAGIGNTFGDAYCFVAIERHTKLILTWHLGRRTARDTLTFMVKLRRATSGRFQLTTDGFFAYPGAVDRIFGSGIDWPRWLRRIPHHAMANSDTRQGKLWTPLLSPRAECQTSRESARLMWRGKTSRCVCTSEG